MFEFGAVQKCAHLVEREKCCQTHIFLQNFDLIQPRTSPANFARSSGAGRPPSHPLPAREVADQADAAWEQKHGEAAGAGHEDFLRKTAERQKELDWPDDMFVPIRS